MAFFGIKEGTRTGRQALRGVVSDVQTDTVVESDGALTSWVALGE